MPAKKKLLNHTQVVPSYSDILRVPSKAKPAPDTEAAREPKRSKAYHLRDGTITAVADASVHLQVPIGDLVDFLLSEGLRAIEEGRLEVPVKQGKKRIILS